MCKLKKILALLNRQDLEALLTQSMRDLLHHANRPTTDTELVALIDSYLMQIKGLYLDHHDYEALTAVEEAYKKMSYDILLFDPYREKTVEIDRVIHLPSGTYAANGSRLLAINVTYNYADRFYRVFGEKGIRALYGMTAEESIPYLKRIANLLGDDTTDNYWESTDGNAKETIKALVYMARLAPPYAIWTGD